MNIDDIRRANIRLLEASAGAPKLAADKVGMTYSQYVNLRDGAKDSRSKKPRAMRKETARRFEIAFDMPAGWLDQPHGSSVGRAAEPPAPPYIHPNATIRQIVALCEGTDEAGRGMALMAVSQALERYRPAQSKAA